MPALAIKSSRLAAWKLSASNASPYEWAQMKRDWDASNNAAIRILHTAMMQMGAGDSAEATKRLSNAKRYLLTQTFLGISE